MRVSSPDGAHHAELSQTEESAGCHGVGGFNRITTVVRVFDRAGREVVAVERTRTHATRENDPEDTITGAFVERVRFTDDGATIVLTLSTGEEETCAISR